MPCKRGHATHAWAAMGPAKNLQAPISPTGSPSRPAMAAMAKSILAPPLHQVDWKIASQITTTVDGPRGLQTDHFWARGTKKGHFTTESQHLDWLEVGVKHHGQQADHPTLASAKYSLLSTGANQ